MQNPHNNNQNYRKRTIPNGNNRQVYGSDEDKEKQEVVEKGTHSSRRQTLPKVFIDPYNMSQAGGSGGS